MIASTLTGRDVASTDLEAENLNWRHPEIEPDLLESDTRILNLGIDL